MAAAGSEYKPIVITIGVEFKCFCQIWTSCESYQLLSSEYNTSTSLKCKLVLAYNSLIETGPNVRGSVVDEEEHTAEEEIEEQRQDHYALLVRAWEAKVRYALLVQAKVRYALLVRG